MKTFVDVPDSALARMERHADSGGVGNAIGVHVGEDWPDFYEQFDRVHLVE